MVFANYDFRRKKMKYFKNLHFHVLAHNVKIVHWLVVSLSTTTIDLNVWWIFS